MHETVVVGKKQEQKEELSESPETMGKWEDYSEEVHTSESVYAMYQGLPRKGQEEVARRISENEGKEKEAEKAKKREEALAKLAERKKERDRLDKEMALLEAEAGIAPASVAKKTSFASALADNGNKGERKMANTVVATVTPVVYPRTRGPERRQQGKSQYQEWMQRQQQQLRQQQRQRQRQQQLQLQHQEQHQEHQERLRQHQEHQGRRRLRQFKLKTSLCNTFADTGNCPPWGSL